MTMKVYRTVQNIREAVDRFSRNGQTTALVPTMGGLHAGHLSLVEIAKKTADKAVASVFVNPKQFNNADDLRNYPRDEMDDFDKLEKAGIDVIYAPDDTEMYPTGFATNVAVDASSNILCDAHRPGHFDGVATVVSKLFLQTGADYAVFGEKDFQQLFIIRKLVNDLNIPIQIVPAKTIREPDGLAMSSRNLNLDREARKIAPELFKAMKETAEAIRNSADIKKTCADAINGLQDQHGFKVEYFEVRNEYDLEFADMYEGQLRLFAAAWLGGVRLIDNLEI